ASLPHHASIHISLLSSTHPPTPQHSPLPLHDALPIFVWLVPLIAAVFAGYLLYNRMHEYGPTIRIMFRDATGLKPGQSEIRYRGVMVGELTALELTPDRAYVLLTARLRREADDIARTG